MSFSDMMSSAKGPGVIGMVIAIFVLIGFGTLFLFAFDEGSGGKSFAAIIRDREKEIDGKKAQIVYLEENLTRIPELKKISKQFTETTSINKSLVPRISKLKSQIAEIHSDNERIAIEREDYKNEYRAAVRSKSAGSKIDELQTTDGEVFKKVEIRKGTAIGIEIRHQNGFKRIGFENLPMEMQDFYQFDKDQMEAERLREAKVRKKHHSEVAAAHQAADVAAADRRVKEQAIAKEKANRDIAVKTAKLSAIEREIAQIDSDIKSAESAADSARAAGRMHLSKAGPLRNRLRSKQAEYSRLQAEIINLRAAL